MYFKKFSGFNSFHNNWQKKNEYIDCYEKCMLNCDLIMKEPNVIRTCCEKQRQNETPKLTAVVQACFFPSLKQNWWPTICSNELQEIYCKTGVMARGRIWVGMVLTATQDWNNTVTFRKVKCSTWSKLIQNNVQSTSATLTPMLQEQTELICVRVWGVKNTCKRNKWGNDLPQNGDLRS